MEKKEWDSKWEWVNNEKIGAGGQGTTFLVKDKSSREIALVKELKHQRNEKARRRMFQEVQNLRALHSAGCKVPKILDSNVELYEQTQTDLYFIMEFIEGRTLAEEIRNLNTKSIQTAIAFTRDLLSTMKIAFAENIQHRDLKPENIIVRNAQSADLVIVDYGLSFNKDSDISVTEVDEMLDNKFLSLPERRIKGSDRRDLRSDITSLCGIFFFCLFSEYPVDLVDEKGNPPHQRDSSNISTLYQNHELVSQLRLFFDRGFASRIEERFQSLEEFETRLLLKPISEEEIESPGMFAVKTANDFMAKDRITQIQHIKNNIVHFPGQMNNKMASIQSQIANTPYKISHSGAIYIPPLKLDHEELNSFVCDLFVANHEERVQLVYKAFLSGTQVGIWRGIWFIPKNNVQDVMIIQNWETLEWFDALKKISIVSTLKDFDQSVVRGMKYLHNQLLNV